MGAKTSIEWTESSWTPIAAFLKEDHLTIGADDKPKTIPAGTRGWLCTKISPGCANCYAEGINLRLGNGLGYVRASLDAIEWRLVSLDDPLRWQRPRRIFVCSMCDLFHSSIPDALIDQVFAVMAMARRHTFQVLTKRPERMRKYLSAPETKTRIAYQMAAVVTAGKDLARLRSAAAAPAIIKGGQIVAEIENGKSWPLPNVHVGTSVEDQPAADARIPELLATPATVRFLSVEPLIGPIDLRFPGQVDNVRFPDGFADWSEDQKEKWYTSAARGVYIRRCAIEIDWLIVGGESGARARPCHVEWIAEIIQQCQSVGVAVFVKQLGGVPVTENANLFDWPDGVRLHAGKASDEGFAFAYIGLKNRKGGDWQEWPEELRVREYPKARKGG